MYNRDVGGATIPEWFTVFDKSFMTPELAREALLQLREFVKAANIPEKAVWKVFPRGIGLVVTAKWKFSDPGAVPATEIDNIGGIPILLKEEAHK